MAIHLSQYLKLVHLRRAMLDHDPVARQVRVERLLLPLSAATLAALYGANNTDAVARSCLGSSGQQSGCRHSLCPS